jgi:hypothetical protein
MDLDTPPDYIFYYLEIKEAFKKNNDKIKYLIALKTGFIK